MAGLAVGPWPEGACFGVNDDQDCADERCCIVLAAPAILDHPNSQMKCWTELDASASKFESI